MPAHGFHQAVIDRERDVLGGHRHLPARAIAAHLCLGDSRLHRAGIGGGKGVDVPPVSLIEGLEGTLSKRTVFRLLQENVVGFIDGDCIPLAVCRIVEGKVRIHQARCRGGRALEHLTEGGKELLILRGEDVGLFQKDLLHLKLKRRKEGILCDLLKVLLREGEDLRLCKAHLCHDLCIGCPCLCKEHLGIVLCGVLVVAQHRVRVDVVELSLEGSFRVKVAPDGGSIPELSLECRHRICRGAKGGEVLLPGAVIPVECCQIPLVAGIAVFSFLQFFSHR